MVRNNFILLLGGWFIRAKLAILKQKTKSLVNNLCWLLDDSENSDKM